MNTINDRMEMLVNERFGGNKAAFAKAIGLSPTGLSNYLSKQRRSKPNVEMITNIITKVGVDPMWLLTGQETPHNEIHTEGDNSPAAINGNINVGEVTNLREKVAMLEQLLEEKSKNIEEKERTIGILLRQLSQENS